MGARIKRINSKPVNKTAGGEFAEQILKDLLNEGYSGEALLEEFENRQAKVRPAVINMLDEAKNVAEGKGAYATHDELFGEK